MLLLTRMMLLLVFLQTPFLNTLQEMTVVLPDCLPTRPLRHQTVQLRDCKVEIVQIMEMIVHVHEVNKRFKW